MGSQGHWKVGALRDCPGSWTSLPCTRSGSGTSVYWLRFDLVDLLQQGDGEVSYRPRVIAADGVLDAMSTEEDDTGQVEEWHRFITERQSGTLVLMTGLSLARAISDTQLLDSLGATILLLRCGEGFSIEVNSEKATIENTLPRFEFRDSNKWRARRVG